MFMKSYRSMSESGRQAGATCQIFEIFEDVFFFHFYSRLLLPTFVISSSDKETST